MNLLSNAAKYTPAGGQVSLVMEELPAGAGESHLRFTVRDTGGGFFRPFFAKEAGENFPLPAFRKKTMGNGRFSLDIP